MILACDGLFLGSGAPWSHLPYFALRRPPPNFSTPDSTGVRCEASQWNYRPGAADVDFDTLISKTQTGAHPCAV